jgi:hypothetical protein
MKGMAFVIAALALAGAASPLDSTADGAPPGMVSFFTSTSCPAGWTAADLAAGRIAVAVNDPLAVGRTVGTPLGPAEDRTHTHAITASLSLPAKSISAADGNNDSGGSSGIRTFSGAAGAASSGLPFVQLTACVRSL